MQPILKSGIIQLNQKIRSIMLPNNKTARLAGLLYLVLVVGGIVNLLYIPSRFIVWESPSETLSNIITSEMLFRVGILSGIVTFLFYILLPLALYKLLNHINKSHALLMVIFALTSVPISFVNMLNKFSILTLIGNANYLKELTTEELQFQVMFYLNAYNNGNQLSQIFWGLWLFPFGYLVFKSGFLPKVLGVLLMAGCFGWIISFLGGFLITDYNETTISTIVGLPAAIGEIGICLWLLIMGTKTLKLNRGNKGLD